MTTSGIMTTVDILRHGETVGGEIFRGNTDVVLSDSGVMQMQKSLHAVSGWQYIVSSPLLRCAEFSRQLAKANNLSCKIIDDLREISFGDWDGKAFKDIREQQPQLFASFWRDPVNHSPPNAEPVQEFCCRVNASFWQVVNQYRGSHILMVVHGGVVRSILGEVLQTEMTSLMRFDVPYASLSRISIYHENDQDWPQLVFHNR